jgi:hypothetical protein
MRYVTRISQDCLGEVVSDLVIATIFAVTSAVDVLVVVSQWAA